MSEVQDTQRYALLFAAPRADIHRPAEAFYSMVRYQHAQRSYHLSTSKHLLVIINTASLVQGKHPSFSRFPTLPLHKGGLGSCSNTSSTSEGNLLQQHTGTSDCTLKRPAPASYAATRSDRSLVSTKVSPLFLPTPRPQAAPQGRNPTGTSRGSAQ